MRTVVHFFTLIAAPGLCLVFVFLLVVQLVAPTVLTGLDTRVTASIAALLFAVFSFFYRSVEKETQSRKQHTINILFTTRLSPEFRQHLEHRKHCFAEGTDIDPDTYTAYLDATRTVDISDDEANRLDPQPENILGKERNDNCAPGADHLRQQLSRPRGGEGPGMFA